MNYQEWNNCISQYFFNPENSGKDVRLYITKDDVIRIGRKEVPGFAEKDAWRDFVKAIQSGIPGTKPDISLIEKAKYCYDQWKKPGLTAIQNIPVTSPLYIGYLAFFILPLTEDAFDFHGRNYYGPLNSFLQANGLKESIHSPRLKELEALWEDLEEWSILTMNGDIGFFTLGKFSPTFKYVGKPFSQCIFSPQAIKRLPQFFFASGMAPNTQLSDRELRHYLLKYGASVLGLKNNVLEIIKKSDDELSNSIVQLVRKEYTRWKGESHELIVNGIVTKTKRNYTVAPLLLQFKLNTNFGEISFSFRMHSPNDYPDDLKFENQEILNTGKGFSNLINHPNRSNLAPFDLKDDFNKWIARFPQKDVRLFISGSLYHLSADYLIETGTLSKTDRMYLLCRNDIKEKIEEWGKTFQTGNFKLIDDLEGLPQDYSLFTFLQPKIPLADIPILQIISEKAIQLSGGLRVTHRTFTTDFLPEIEIINADGNEQVYLQYRNDEEKIPLRKKQSFNNHWLLPADIYSDVDFYIRVNNEIFSGNEISYSLVSTDNHALHLNNDALPKRDSFGRRIDGTSNQYSIGSNVVGGNLRRQELYKQFFSGVHEDLNTDLTIPVYSHSDGNVLLSFLTYKGVSSTEEFYGAFEYLHSRLFANRNFESSLNYSKIKKASINMYDYLGYLDYDYETKEIVVNLPQFILIPAEKGRCMLLIGGRDKVLVDAIIKAAPHHNLKVEITRQSQLNENLLLPDAITIKAFGKRTENFGENRLRAFAAELGIAFNPNDLIQAGMLEFSSNIDTYEQDLLANNETTQDDYDWARRVFNPETLKYDRSTGEFDRTFSLIEYKLNEYTYYNRLWKNQRCYQVDKNWGKYLALKHYSKQVILFDEKKHKVAIPLELPLPRLLAESIMLLSGLAPVYTKINSRNYRIYENIPGPFIKNLFDKLKQTTIGFNL